jgi:nucleoside-diphosphate-sugar epimerase
MSTVLITGVNGFIGSHLAAHLAKCGHRIVGSTSSEAGLRIATPGVAHKVVLRLGGPCDAGILRGIDVVIHCAWDLRQGAIQANIDGTKQLLEVAEQAGVPYQLFLSSYSAHPLAVSAYGGAKLVVQEECLRRGLAAVRPGLVVGAGGLFQRISDIVARHLVVPLVDSGRARVPIIAVADLRRALADIMERRLTGLFSLFNPDLITLKALMLEIRAAARRRTLLIPVPSRLLLGSLWLMSKVRITPPINVDSLRGLQANLYVKDRSDLPAFVPRPLTLAEMVRAASLVAHGS